MSKTKKNLQKTGRPKTAKRSGAAKKPSALDAAARVLGETRTAMTCKELIETMAKKGYWSSPGGKTPSATLCSALLREIATKAKDSRFKKSEPGKFTLS
jgi:hypothetical protein